MIYYKKAMKYFSAHPMYNATIHAIGGMAIGVLIARPLDSGHPVQLAAIFAAIAIIGHLVPLFTKK